jgi:hypothetical protein
MSLAESGDLSAYFRVRLAPINERGRATDDLLDTPVDGRVPRCVDVRLIFVSVPPQCSPPASESCIKCRAAHRDIGSPSYTHLRGTTALRAATKRPSSAVPNRTPTAGASPQLPLQRQQARVRSARIQRRLRRFRRHQTLRRDSHDNHCECPTGTCPCSSPSRTASR